MILYLTRIPLNLGSHEVRSELSNRYSLHQTLTRVFAEPGESRILYRVEDDASLNPYILVQSSVQPDLAAFYSNYVARSGQVETRDITSLIDRFEVGRRFRFRIAINPTTQGRKIQGGREIEFRRVLHKNTEAISWFAGMGERRGFALPLSDPFNEPTMKKLAMFRGKSPKERVAVSLIDGVLEVTNPQAFAAAFVAGIGKAKIYGLGMLSLATA